MGVFFLTIMLSRTVNVLKYKKEQIVLLTIIILESQRILFPFFINFKTNTNLMRHFA